MIHHAALCPVCSQPATERKFRPFCSAECSNLDLERVRGELIAGLEQLAEELLGPPSIQKPRTWRWGSKGAFVLEMHGRKRGAWHDKDGEQGGGPFHLIAHARSCSMAQAIGWARDWTGGAPEAGHDYKAERAARQADRDRKAREQAIEDERDAVQRMGVADQMWSRSSGLAGSIAEGYLLRVRRIPAPTTWPDAVRFHGQTCSLIVSATLGDGALQAVQRVRLTPAGEKMPHSLDSPTKVTNGILAGAAVRLPGMATGPLLLAEGPETGLSVWAATGYETWIALGGMGGLALPHHRQVVACRDDDPKHSPGDRKMVRAVEGWRNAGYQVAVATPWPFRAYDKTDFNDTLKLDGAAGIRRRVAAALNPGGGAPTRLPIRQVRDQLRTAIAGFFDGVRDYDAAGRALPAAPEPDRDSDLLDWNGEPDPSPAPQPPAPGQLPVHAVKTDVGTGKTVTTMAESIRLLSEMRAVGDRRSAVFAVPTHKLGDEQAVIFEVHARGSGLTVAVWRGLSAPDPDSPADTMCRNLEAVADAREALQPVIQTCCKRKMDDGTLAVCPFFDVCGYQRQRETKADLWIVAHEMVFGEKPSTFGRLAFLVIDEAIWADGLEGTSGKPTTLAVDALANLPPLPPGTGGERRLGRERLDYLRSRLLDVLRTLPEGPITAEALDMSDLTLANTREAYALEWAQFIDAGLHPGMARPQRREAALRAAGNAAIPRFSRVWQAVTALLEDGGPQRSGWVEVALQPTDDGVVKVLHLRGRRKVRKGWQVPTLLIDATMNIDLVRPYWPDVQVTAELLADAPHQTIRQVVDRAFSKSAIEPMTEDQPGYSDDEARRRQRGLRMVHAVLNREARRYGGAPVLAVAQKAVREALPSFGPLATCIDLGHHNAVAGRDEWRDVRALIVIGRTQPAPASVERLAAALTGRAVERIGGWYQRGDGVRHTAEDGAITVEVDRHPDPIVEAIRWQVCEGELVQIIGRGRGVNRTEDNPLDVLVLTDSPLPLPVAETIQAADLAPSPTDLMLSAGGGIFENPRDAAEAYPALWPSKEAAKKALQRSSAEAKVGTFPYIDILLGECPHLQVLTYQRAGRGQQPSRVACDASLVPNPAEWLTEKLGALAWCHGEDPDPSSPAPSADPQRQSWRPDEPALIANGLAEAEARWGPPPDRHDQAAAPDIAQSHPEPEDATMLNQPDAEPWSRLEAARLPPATIYPPTTLLMAIDPIQNLFRFGVRPPTEINDPALIPGMVRPRTRLWWPVAQAGPRRTPDPQPLTHMPQLEETDR